MKRLIIMMAAAVLLVTGGTYAATYSINSTTELGVVSTGQDFVTVTAQDLSGLTPTVFGEYTGSWGSGPLFTVEPDTGYTGDMVIRVILTNTGELKKYYEHLNMKVEFQSSDNTTADEQGIPQILSLDNSEAAFTWVNGNGTPPFRITLVGGGYRLHPYKTFADGSVKPELWVDVSDR